MRLSDLRDRTKKFALRIVRMYISLPTDSQVAQVMGKQVLRSGTSVGANIREASRGRSDAELLAKLGIAEQELDETRYWLELFVEAVIVPPHMLAPLQREGDELLRIIVASTKTIRGNTRKEKSRRAAE